MKSGIPTLDAVHHDQSSILSESGHRPIIELKEPELDHHTKTWKAFLNTSDKSLVTKPATKRMNIDPFYESVFEFRI